MKIYVTTDPEYKRLNVRFGEGVRAEHITFLEAEIQPSREWRRLIYDVGRIVSIEGYRLRIIHENTPTTDGPYSEDCHVFHLDTAKFFTALRIIVEKNQKIWQEFKAKKDALHAEHYSEYWEKKPGYWEKERALINEYEKRYIKTVWHIESFRANDCSVHEMTVMEMVKHPNCQSGYMPKTLMHFRKKLKAEEWPRFINRISDLIPQTKMIGQGDEFYFDGRGVKNGCGYNGGIILHGDSFGIHT